MDFLGQATIFSWDQGWARAVLVKYDSINRRSTINLNVSVLIYPIIAVGCLALSNVLWRWAFHILYRFPLHYKLHQNKRNISHTVSWSRLQPQGRRAEEYWGVEGWIGGEKKIKNFNPFKTVSFFLQVDLRAWRAKITGVVIGSSKSAELSQNKMLFLIRQSWGCRGERGCGSRRKNTKYSNSRQVQASNPLF